MGATLSQPVVLGPSLPSSGKAKPKRPRFRFRLRIRWRRKRKSLPEIRAFFPESLGHHDHKEYRESKLYDSTSTDEGDEEKFFFLNSCTCTSATSSTGLPVPITPLAEGVPEAAASPLEESQVAVSFNDTLPPAWPSSPTLPIYPLPFSISKRKPLPSTPIEIVSSSEKNQTARQQKTHCNISNQLVEVSENSNNPVEENPKEEDHAGNESLQHDASDIDPNFDSEFDSDPDSLPRERQRPHTPPPWDTSLTGYGSVLEISRPFRARRVFEHPLVEGHFLANKRDLVSSNGGPLAAEKKRKMWRVWEETSGKGEKPIGLKSRRGSTAVKGEKGNGKKSKKSKTKVNRAKRMSEWRRWKPLPSYPACTEVAQRASTWAATGNNTGGWIEVAEETEDQEYQAGDEREEEDEDEEDIDEAIKRFLDMKIPVDMESLYRLRARFAGPGGETAIIDNEGTGEAEDGGLMGEAEGMAKETEEFQFENMPSRCVESLFFTDTDIEGFEFLAREENDESSGGGAFGAWKWDESLKVEVETKKTGAGPKLKRGFSATQRLSRWKEPRLEEERRSDSGKKVE